MAVRFRRAGLAIPQEGASVRRKDVSGAAVAFAVHCNARWQQFRLVTREATCNAVLLDRTKQQSSADNHHHLQHG